MNLELPAAWVRELASQRDNRVNSSDARWNGAARCLAAAGRIPSPG